MKKVVKLLILGIISLLIISCSGNNTTKIESNGVSANIISNESLDVKKGEDFEKVEEKKTALANYNRGSISKNEIQFPIGNTIENSPAFTGTPYIQNLIPLEEVYNFPESNEVTFEPGARSNWHRHGGMVVLVTAGVGYYQEEGKKAQIIRSGDVVLYLKM